MKDNAIGWFLLMAVVVAWAMSDLKQWATSTITVGTLTCVHEDGKGWKPVGGNIIDRRYRASHDSQLVVESFASFVIKGKDCTVFDEENWECKFLGTFTSAIDGNLAYRCTEGPTCHIPVFFLDKVFLWVGNQTAENYCSRLDMLSRK